MNKTEEIIKVAQKGGYADHSYCNEFDMYECTTDYCHYKMFCDPLFWQAIGRVKGWDWAICMTCDMKVPLFGECQCDEEESEYPKPVMGWKFNALHFNEINLSDPVTGWDNAIDYLYNLIK
jgi:hypothetical protein